MKNFKFLLLHDIQRQLHSFKFVIVVIFAIFITGVCIYINILDFNDKQYNYQAEITRTQDQMKSFRCYGEFKIPILIAPNPLTIFAKGVDDEVGNKAVIDPMEPPLLEKTSEESNPFLVIFSYLDITKIVILVLSLLILLIVTDSISGDRENQTLKVIFANSVSRAEYLLVKYLSSLLISLIPLLLIFILTSLMSIFFLSSQLDSYYWIGIILILLSCILFISFFVLLGLLVSVRSSNGASSAMNGLFLWCTIIILYPATINYLVTSFSSKPSEIKLEQGIADINNTFIKEHTEYMMKNRHTKATNVIGPRGYEEIYKAFFSKYAGLTQKYEYERLEKNNADMLPLYFTSRDKVLELQDQYARQILNQEKTINHFSFFLPNSLMKNASEKIAHTDRMYRDFQFNNSIREYKKSVMDYLSSKNAFGMSFFVLLPKDQMKDDFSEYTEELKQKYINDEALRLDLNDIPVFYFPKSFDFPLEILILIIINVLLFILLYRLFIYADLT